jgi:hypothetical protein
MADRAQIDQFLKSFWQWRNSLSPDQRWMADALGWSAAHTADVQGYQEEQWSWDQMGSWLDSQNSKDWQKWSQSWKSDARWGG